MPDPFRNLLDRLGELRDLSSVASLLEWDQQVMMPSAGAASRAEQQATIARLAHDRLIDPALGELLEELRPFEASHPRESFEASVIRVTRRDHEKAVRVPSELEAEMMRTSSAGQQAWAAARRDSDYAAFRPWLDRTLALKREYVACFEPYDDPYDPLLDDFERDLRTEDVRSVFTRLRPALVHLVDGVASEELESFERADYPQEAQLAMSLEVAKAFGTDSESFRLDPTVHPFCMAISVADIRLTTRYEPGLAGHSLFSTMHEVGHGLYERGIDTALDRTPLAHGCSSALHESQSRLWENVVGRSLPFWRWLYPRMREASPEILADVPLERFHRAVNRVKRSFIRVEADEVTYGLHIILRFELEQELLARRLSTGDLPEAWDTRFEELLGVRPPDERLGCLQDVHWAAGLFGYFPTYQLGNVLAAQIWGRLCADIPDTDELMSRGDFEPIREWLRARLYRLGRTFTPTETIELVAGGPIDPEPYLGYLQAKFA
jgi:carboxypeptidase Taq